MSFGGRIELNVLPVEMFQPYLGVGYYLNKNTVEVTEDEFEDGPDVMPLTFGFVVPILEGTRFIMQLSWTMNEDTKE